MNDWLNISGWVFIINFIFNLILNFQLEFPTLQFSFISQAVAIAKQFFRPWALWVATAIASFRLFNGRNVASFHLRVSWARWLEFFWHLGFSWWERTLKCLFQIWGLRVPFCAYSIHQRPPLLFIQDSWVCPWERQGWRWSWTRLCSW